MVGIVILLCILLFLLLIIGRNTKKNTVVEWIMLFWFRLACAIAILFFINLLLNENGSTFVMNSFSILVITILGLPGLICIGVIHIFLREM